jgi:aspartate carbamoyltransferase catalytic subunit
MTAASDGEGALAKSWQGRSVITMEDLSHEDIELVFALARSLGHARRERRDAILLSGSVLGVLFFQPSTRTRLSFETAMLRLGGTVSGFADAAVTRAGDFYKESLEDVVRFVSELVDVLVLRHFETGAATRAAGVSAVPVLNAGDGYGQHPTQAMGDLFTMREMCGGLDGLSVGLVGDMHLRSLRSVCFGLSRFSIGRVLILAPDGGVDRTALERFDAAGIPWELHDDIAAVVPEVDVLETIGVRQPNHGVQRDLDTVAEATPERFRLTAEKLSDARPDLRVLHPGPRTDEITVDVDRTPHAGYFDQFRLGTHVRMALLSLVLGADVSVPQSTVERGAETRRR